MYESLTTMSGIAAVNKFLSDYEVEEGPDGLSLIWNANAYFGEVAFPDRLREWLVGLRLLRGVPLAYLVPDAALLPPESIRFFHVDPSWVDRVIDGVFAAANTGTVDFVFSYRMLHASRGTLDGELTDMAKAQVPSTQWAGGQPMTGMLIRSELVRRWPDMVIRGYKNTNPPPAPDPSDPPPPTVALLRAEPISKDIYIALFAGQPGVVHVREPNVGTRYGVESQNAGGGLPYKIDARPKDGNTLESAPQVVISFRDDPALRIINLKELAQDGAQAASSNDPANKGDDSPRQVALNLEQLPYVQEFKGIHPESRGSVDPATIPGNVMTFRRPGRSMTLDKLKARKAELEASGS